jgi:hypothetical protein
MQRLAMQLLDIIRELISTFAGDARKDRLADLRTGLKRRHRDSKHRLRTAFLTALVWIPILAWVVTAFYRSTLREEELLAQREERAQAAMGPLPQPDG